MSELTIEEKSRILFRSGFIQREDRGNVEKIERRWQVYQSTPQKTSRVMRDRRKT